VPALLRGYARLEQTTAKLHRVDKRLRALAELKAATLTHCASRIDMGSQISRRWASVTRSCWRRPPIGPARSSPTSTSSCSTTQSPWAAPRRGVRRAAGSDARANRARPTGGAHPPDRVGAHARSLWPRTRYRRGGLQSWNGLCGPHSHPAIRTRKCGHELAAEGLNEVRV